MCHQLSYTKRETVWMVADSGNEQSLEGQGIGEGDNMLLLLCDHD